MNSLSILLLLIVLFSSQSQSLSDQASALLQLKNGFSSMIDLNPPWIRGTNCCNWDGVLGDAASGLVVSLDLSSHNISGNISSSLFDLTSLQSLNLADNLFYRSSLPVLGFEKLGNLTHLNLSNSGFSGQVPSSISHLKKLVSLDLSTLFVNGGQLENPDLRALIRGLSKLQELYLDGLISLIVALIGVKLSPNPFLGFKFSVCLVVRFRGQSISLCPNSRICRMLSGYLPEFPKESALERLILESTNFSGILPASLGNLKSLTKLDLMSCHFSGSIPSSIGNLSQLVNLDLSRNGFTGAIPLQMGGQRILDINLSHNNLNGTLPCSFGRLPNLTNLDLSDNSLSGSIPVTLFSLPALQVLQLNQNKFSGQLEEISDASVSLDFVDLSDNELQGEIPKLIFGISTLKYLALASNNFSGKLELDLIGHLRNLSYLDLSRNMLSILNGSGDSSLLFPSITELKLKERVVK
ncbi:hypothetical protein J5N97_013787 [Dioscorea zingiberensis]|uniref:Leucine-rich repeat-containing N-terminal plant-type domain-containing protein n=1 Tax=Dioscorea zingiberensis TaxID=325984 RepID=A0A9D5CRW8_9LILI|nr:hypothetical protein J5N97_013787 [Dioscorea zingiberensis]